ncbi:MAG: hypothetical protein PHW01_02575 [Patescibacteria group bacterium]|nr:hypothetical protein [Patescibacteria group bacterium]
MFKFKLFSTIILALLGISLVLNLAHAALVPCGGTGQPECNLCHFFVLIQTIFKYLLGFLGIVALLIFVIIGFMFLFGSTNEGLLTTGKKALTSAIIGLVLVLVAWLIINTVGYAIGWAQKGSWWTFNCVSE